MFADISSPGTVENLASNPNVEIVVVEILAAASVVSPAYDGDATEEAIAARWLRHHTDLHHAPR